MPKGAYPLGSFGSRNSPGVFTSLKRLLKTSTVALDTSAANSSGPALGVVASARPLNTALAGVLPPAPPEVLSSTTNLAPPFQAAISPGDCLEPTESVATIKSAAAPLATWKALWSELNTCPVGLPPGTGTVRSSVTLLPLTPPPYTEAKPELLSDTQIGVLGPAARPHALTRCLSTSLAPSEALLAIRLVWAKLLAGADTAPVGAPTATIPAVAMPTVRAYGHLLAPRGRSGPGCPALLGGTWRMTDPFVVWQQRGRGHAGPATDSTAGHAKGFSGRSAKMDGRGPPTRATAVPEPF